MKEVVRFFKREDLKMRYGDRIICMEAQIMAKEGDVPGAISYFRTNIKTYTEDAKRRFEGRLIRKS